MDDVLIGLLATVLCILALRGWALLLAARRTARDDVRARFFERAYQLLADDTLDEADLVALQARVAQWDQSRLFWAVMGVLHEKARRDGSAGPAPVKSRPPAWTEMNLCYYFAVSYNSLLFGWLMRLRLVSFLVPKPDIARVDMIEQRLHLGPVRAA